MKQLLFTTPSCPICPAAIHLLQKNGIHYECIDATKNNKLTKKYLVLKAPTLVVVSTSSYTSYYGLEEIKNYIQSKKVDG